MKDSPGEVASKDFRLREWRATEEIVLVVESNSDPWAQATAAARALVCGSLANRLDGQALYAAFSGIARNASRTGIDHIADARDCQT